MDNDIKNILTKPFWHDKDEMIVIRDLLTKYMDKLDGDEPFDYYIFNVRNRLNSRLQEINNI